MPTVVEVEIWSDIVCPWCYIGKRRFERAIGQLGDDIEVRSVYRPYQLDPGAPIGTGEPVSETYSKKFGGPERAAQIIEHVSGIAAGEGLDFRMDRAVRANTMAAHRLMWFAEQTGHQHQLKERLLRAYFHDGLDIGDDDVLVSCATDAGMDGDDVREFQAGDLGSTEVAALIQFAAQNEISAVPTYVIAVPGAQQAFMVPGAQDSDVFERVLRQVVQRAQPPDDDDDDDDDDGDGDDDHEAHG